MRLFFSTIIAAVIAGFLVCPAAADPLPQNAPLASGKPAGIQSAQLSTPSPLIFVGLGIGIIALGLYLADGPKVNTSGANAATGTP
jgi:hypothetical protein